ncbi:MAG: hypothetical protein Q8919_13775, partial [Bacteroidota bacterium]|nr:hypothetical protein [Bacteroidota bacterium]
MNQEKTSYHKPHKEGGIFHRILVICASFLVLLLVGVFVTLVAKSILSIKVFGFGFITGQTWNPVTGMFSGLPYIVGTVVTAVLALAISFPFGMSLAILLGEYYRTGFLATILKNLLEMLAGIPSVIYGFFGMIILVPFIREVFPGQTIGDSLLAVIIIL